MIWRWRGTEFVAAELEPTFQAVVLAARWYPSKSAAQKGIERGEVLWLSDYKTQLQKVSDWKQKIPSGWPVTIARKKPYPQWVTVMASKKYQGRRSWTRIWNEQTLRRWDVFLDWVERTLE